MAEENIQTNEETVNEEITEERLAFRRRRVKRIKRLLIVLLIVFLLIPNLFCAFLLYKLYKMDQHIDNLSQEIKISKAEIERKTRESAAKKQSMEEIEGSAVTELEQSNIPDEEKYPDCQLVYLTFDDGPSKYTDEILDILKEHGVRATFFVLAKEGYDDQYSRMANEGHTVGIHSYSHKYSAIYASLDSFKSDVTAVSDFVTAKTGTRPTFYRFPGGSSNSVHKASMQDMIHFLTSENYVYYDWNVSSEDASSTMKEASVIARNVINGVGNKKQAVVLMHDAASKRSTVEALPLIIESLQAKGNVVFLPITEGTNQVYHIKEKNAPIVDEDPEPLDDEEETKELKPATETVPDEE